MICLLAHRWFLNSRGVSAIKARSAVVETDSGLTMMAIPPDMTIEDVAAQRGGHVVDPGPFDSYDDTYDAMLAIRDEEKERESPHE